MIYEVIYSDNNNDINIFDKKKVVMLLLEFIRVGFRFRELKSLSKLGYNFYIEKNVYLDYIVELPEEEYAKRLENINNNHFFKIENKKSQKMRSTTNKIEIPSKVLEKLKENLIEISDYEIKNLNSVIVNESPRSMYGKIKETIYEYLNFFKNYLGIKINFIELLYILKPFIYLSLMICFDKKNFIPLLVNAVIDILILSIKRHEENFNQQKIYTYEYIFRMGRLGVYFLREPIFSMITSPFIKKILKIIRVPNFIVDIIMNLLSYYTNLNFILS